MIVFAVNFNLVVKYSASVRSCVVLLLSRYYSDGEARALSFGESSALTYHFIIFSGSCSNMRHIIQEVDILSLVVPAR
jgi:hypothetical protein